MNKEGISNIKSLALDMINEANSGHPGIALSSAPILYTLFKYHLNINPKDPDWYNRDRFVMSPGHGSSLLYATLYYAGFNLTIDDLKNFRQINSKTPGHPEYKKTEGVECSTGPLGQGLGMSIGLALGSKVLSNLKIDIGNRNIEPVNFNTYVLVSDGDLMEGISYEVCSLAGTLNLNNLIILYDSNGVSLDGSTHNTFKEDVESRFKAMGFDTYTVNDGNNVEEINEAITKAKISKSPAFIEIKTHIGYGSLYQDTNKVHGKPLDKEDLTQLKKKLGVKNKPFYVDKKAKEDFINSINKRVLPIYEESIDTYNKYIKDNLDKEYKQYKFYFDKNIKYNISDFEWHLQNTSSMRDISEYALNNISSNINAIIGGSADLNSSTKTYLKDRLDITSKNFNGKNIWFGVREHGMGAIANGLALLNFIPFVSTFLSFSDYLKPAIRMAALQKLKTIFIFTHDSVEVGMDGPTHEPVEQLASLRSIPNLDVYRPCDLKELIGTYQSILINDNPSCIIISRSKNNLKLNTSANETLKGGYVVEEQENYQTTLISTGNDLYKTYEVKKLLDKENIKCRLVSVPCPSIFDKQSLEYKNQVLGKKIRIVIEESNSLVFTKYTDYENIIGINEFGFSGKEEDVIKEVGFDLETLKNKIKKRLN